MEYCVACGMPLEKEEFIGNKIDEGSVCIYCIDENKNIKNAKEIFDGGVAYFKQAFPDLSDLKAQSVVRTNMLKQEYWKNHHDPILDGDTLSEEEFNEILKKL